MLQEAGLPPSPPSQRHGKGWLAKARNPTSRIAAQLQAAEEKIKQMEHERNEEMKIGETRYQEQTIKIDQ